MSDPERSYTTAEEESLARNLLGLSAQIHRGELRGREASVGLLCEVHRALFSGVRAHAGQHRQRGFGSEHLSFGPNRSVNRTDVPGELERIFRSVRVSIASFDENPNDPDYDESAFRLAVWAHAEIVRVHPFADGNGRSARAIMNWILVRLGLRPVAIEVPKNEYHSCLNHYYRVREIQPLVDLALSLYPVD